MGRLAKIWTAAFPPRCALCQGPGWRGLDLCSACVEELPRPGRRCPLCARELELPSGLPCAACIRRRPAFDRVVAPFRYQAPIDFFIQLLKFHDRLEMATLLAALFDLEAPAGTPVALIPVPLHPHRLRQRGFNQALELARPLAERRSVALLQRLTRCRVTVPQSELPAARRRRNLKRAFSISGAEPLPAHVAVVDDVMTTGATADECAATLKANGVERVDVWVMARA